MGLIPHAGALTCQRSNPMTSEVVVAVDSDGIGHTSGIQRCANVWSCPVCAPIVRERRAIEVDEGVAAALAQGLDVFFVTATIPHYGSDSLARSFSEVVGGWSAMWSGRQATALRASIRMVGQVRAIEATWGARNGWHPHVHALVICEPGTSVRSLSSRLKQAWSHTVLRRSGRLVHQGHGLDVSQVRTAGDVSRYLTKVEGGWGAGLEIARTDLKSTTGRLTPSQLLELAADEDRAALDLWLEWEQVTYRRRAIQWTPGLRDRLGLNDVVTDEEAAVEDVDEEQIVLRITYAREVWDRAVDLGREWELIAAAELQAVALGLVPPLAFDTS